MLHCYTRLGSLLMSLLMFLCLAFSGCADDPDGVDSQVDPENEVDEPMGD